MNKKKRGRPARPDVKVINAKIDKGLHAKLYAEADKKRWSIRAAIESVIAYYFSNGGDKQ